MKNFKAFTLVEISVVLLIISIILSCIYRGSEMITQAKLKSVIKDLYKYQAAFNQFVTQYNALPGDFLNAATIWPSASPATANGNGNGYIEYASNTNIPIEDTYVYQHLYLSGILTEGYSGGLISSSIRKSTNPKGNLPAAKYTNGTYEMFTEILYGQTATYLEFGSLVNSTNGSANGPILSPIDCNYIDKKIDDGLASAGFIFGGNSSNTVTGCAADFSAFGGNYFLTSKNVSCRLAMFLAATN